MPSVSIIIPLYNKGGTVTRAMDSIFAQTCQDFEVIVVDDGSTDTGPEIVKEYKDPRLRFIRQGNAGPGAARNRGVKESSSPYVTFLDADDEWLPEFLEASLANLRNNPDCVVSVVNHFRGNDKILATRFPEFDIGIVTGPWRLPPDIEPREFWGYLIYLQSCGSVMCRRDVFLEFGGAYEHHCTRCEDQYLWLQILLHYRIYCDTSPFFWYHTEDSELEGPNRRSPKTLFPFLSDPAPIRKKCPVDYRLTLERLLQYVAQGEFYIMVSEGDIPAIKYLLQEFPMIKNGRYNYWRVRIKTALPWLVPYVRRVKKLFQGSRKTGE